MTYYDWVWLMESCDDSGRPLVSLPALPYSSYDFKRLPGKDDAMHAPCRRVGPRAWLHHCLALLRTSRRVVAQDPQSDIVPGSNHDAEVRWTKAA